jgi:hypothetical protein
VSLVETDERITAMAKTPHPADIAANAAIARAVSFNVHLRIGPFDKTNRPAANLAEARSIAASLQIENRGKPALIYAITPEGTSHLVPASYQPAPPAKSKEEPKMSEFTAIQIAQLSTVLTGGGVKRSNSKEAAAKRFRVIADNAGADADKALGMEFDAAKDYLTGVKNGVSKKPDLVAAAPAVTVTEAPTAPKVAKPKAEKAEAKPAGQRAAVLEAAKSGTLPSPPDFSAKTHERFRPKLARLVEMAEAGNLDGLKAEKINPVSSSPKALAKYRDLCVTAIEAGA